MATTANQVYDCIGKYGFIYRKGQQGHQLQFSLPAAATAAGTFTSEESVYAASLTSQDEGTDHSIASSHQGEGAAHSRRAHQEAIAPPISRQPANVIPSQPQPVFPNGGEASAPSNVGGAPTVDEASVLSNVSSNGFDEKDGIDIGNEEDIAKEVELSVFLKELKKIYSKPLPGERSFSSEADIDAALESLAGDSELYFQYLSSEEPTTTASRDRNLQNRIDHLKATLERYKSEMKAWDDVTRLKERVVEDSKKTFDSERDVDFSQLHCEDVETLKSYLIASQTGILEQPLMVDPQFTSAMEKQLNAIDCKLDAELKRIQDHCHLVNSRLKLGNHQDDTPRTVFKALKNHS